MTNKKLIGVDLGGTTIKFAILTAEGEIQQKWSLRTNILDEGSHIVPDIIDSINHHIDLYKMSKDQFIGIGMGTPGTIDLAKGTVKGAYNLNWKTTQNVKDQIEEGTGLKFALDNDAKEGWRTGLVTTFVKEIPFDSFDGDYAVVVVGPPPMMKFTGLELMNNGVDAEKVGMSFERKMSCAVGKCGHCRIDEGYVCLDGPVFPYTVARDLVD